MIKHVRRASASSFCLSSVHFTPLLKEYGQYKTDESSIPSLVHAAPRSCTRTNTPPADHRAPYKLLSQYIYLSSASGSRREQKRLLSVAKWQSEMVTVFLVLPNGERWQGAPASSFWGPVQTGVTSAWK